MQNFLVKSASTIFQNVAFWNNFGHFPSPPHPPFPPTPPPKKKKKKERKKKEKEKWKRQNPDIYGKTFHVQIHELGSEPNNVIAILTFASMVFLLPCQLKW